MSRFIVTGAKGGSTQGAVAPNRREINDLVKDKVQFSLYVQALSKPLSGCAHHPTGLLTPKQLRCIRLLSPTNFLTLVWPEYTVSLSCSGRVPVAPAPLREPDGVDIAIMEMCYSRPGTGPT
jgi:hypothetical protein